MGRGRKNGNPSNSKPLYLLTLITLIGDGNIVKNRILFSDSIVSRYDELCAKLEPNMVITPMYKPFFHLNSESYYHIKWRDDSAPKDASRTPSAQSLRENVEYARLDDDLWQLLQDEDARNEIKEAIIGYFIEPIKELK